MTQEAMEVNYSITMRDWEAWNQLANKPVTGKPLWRWDWFFMLGYYGLVPLVALVFDSLDLHASSHHIVWREAIDGAWLYASLGASVYGWILWAMNRTIAKRSRFASLTPPYREFWEPRQVRISPSGVKAEMRFQVTDYRWSAFWKLSVTDDYLFFISNSAQTECIPRVAFDSNTDFEAFITLARRYHEESAAAPFAPTDGPPTENTDVQPKFEDHRTARR